MRAPLTYVNAGTRPKTGRGIHHLRLRVGKFTALEVMFPPTGPFPGCWAAVALLFRRRRRP